MSLNDAVLAMVIAIIAATPPTLAVVASFMLHRKHEQVARATYLLLNGDTERKIEEAYQRGLQDGSKEP